MRTIMTETRSPFAGLPETIQYDDEERGPVIEVRTSTIGPVAKQLEEVGTGVIAFLGLVFACHQIFFVYSPKMDNVVLWGTIASLISLFYIGMLNYLLHRETLIRFTVDRIEVCRSGKWVYYDRRQQHRFSLFRHDRADWEKLKEEHKRAEAALKRKAYKPRYFFSDSYFVSLDHYGQRNDLMCVFRHPDAMQILTRLQACDEIMDSYARAGNKAVLDPAADWAPQPGDLPAE
ncbi:hypothetical protein PZ895_14405 [Mesorhizobium sp. YIM 152430]|uniref:hypothetical protein n=1 Tax=Mesorhizobium sp. YIM 152430 TaxID=3031761 RepID=UPI0023DA2FA6|nr:hypothetical protein [Mesorhizobium sp. YIM 152430]MDF1600951.1 hypothetical protein [Mesorhizobium sp. YIM 152430]